MSISDERRQYTHGALDPNQLDSDPLTQFRRWLDDAIEAKLVDATSMTLATATLDGRPSARVVLLKGMDENGFVFYTDYESRKGQELSANPYAAMVFYWSKFDRQVRVEGRVEKIARDQSRVYFHSRPRDSQLAALASHQSTVIKNRVELETRMDTMALQFKGNQVPRPEHWGGYSLIPQTIEFWQGRSNRLHDRLLFTRHNEDWQIDRLSP